MLIVGACGEGESGSPTDAGDDAAIDTDAGDTDTIDTDCSEDCVKRVDLVSGDDLADGSSWETAFLSIQVGIDSAVSSTGPSCSCQVWITSGLYDVADGAMENTIELPAGIELYGGFTGDETSIDQRDLVANMTALDGADLAMHIVTAADHTVLDGFEITRGYATDEGTESYNYQDCGGGLFHTEGSMTVRNCLFHDNQSHSTEYIDDGDWLTSISHGCGAAIYSRGTDLRVESSRFLSNSGGAIESVGDLTVMSSVFEDNSLRDHASNWDYEGNSEESDGGSGAAIHAAVANINGCSFTNNSSVYGGAVFSESLSLSDSVFHDNSAIGLISSTWAGSEGIGFGGAVLSESGDVEIRSTEFVGNSADYGGAVFSESSMVIDSCWFSENSAGLGGAVVVSGASASPHAVLNSVFDSNVAPAGAEWSDEFDFLTGPSGGAIAALSCAIPITNTVFYNNSAVVGGAAYFHGGASVTAISNSIFQSNGTGDDPGIWGTVELWYCVSPNPLLGAGNVQSDPMFIDPENGDFHLQSGSPCIDAANGDLAPTLDFEGNARVDDPATIDTGVGAITCADVGAYEYQP